jgi:5-carboxymethyl-2-hydroxymuconate isomerase
MPNTLIEYTANLEAEADIPGAIGKLAALMRDNGAVFPVAGIRIRAARYDDYAVGDGDPENGFVVVTYKIAAGRSPDVKKAFFDQAFELLMDHFRDLHARRPFALAAYVEEIPEGTGYRWNSMRERPKTAAG